MGTLICQECERIIAPIASEKSEVLYGVCPDCDCHDHDEK
ncbi:GapA-binding peptide SR1P [Tepidibacillus fermentans]|nr:GapA-binding peptide SR1P [Tepidibacillus fermentans]